VLGVLPVQAPKKSPYPVANSKPEFFRNLLCWIARELNRASPVGRRCEARDFFVFRFVMEGD